MKKKTVVIIHFEYFSNILSKYLVSSLFLLPKYTLKNASIVFVGRVTVHPIDREESLNVLASQNMNKQKVPRCIGVLNAGLLEQV